ncbi:MULTISPECIES: hypothetical protein [Streptomyces]|uniref:hypothetical protein n=1 Tax=Streptomyces TaxID=1883 RepID=UPI00226F22DD|nr:MULTISPECIES: hypothetical protein [unclassified Streptomyces]MCY0940175.1 hypothetical protein [Streptomyces sp. H34-AA3]MCZ4080822.1 hypothetical protein [Streptomyces sp. H34-S5]
MLQDPLKIWYVAGQRLCNLKCPYCVSTGEWAKSNRYDWKNPADRNTFAAVVDWIASTPRPVEVRLGSLGEPFASPFFLQKAGWLTQQPGVRYVELLSNGSLLKQRLPRMAPQTNLGKLSLWLTWHEGQLPLEKFIEGAVLAQEEYGCFVVVNALLFDSHDTTGIQRARAAAAAAGLRFNVDLGYDPTAPSESFDHTGDPARAVPAMRDGDVLSTVTECGGDAALTQAALTALSAPLGRACRAGHDYLFIDIHGQVYRCSRYAALERALLGSILDTGFEVPLRPEPWAPCEAASGCCNKEDFLNLQLAAPLRPRDVPSLGWTNA